MNIRHEEVIRKLSQYIKENDIKPGDRLPSERELADSFNINRTTLRSILQRLATMNIITIIPNSGIYLKDVEDALDLNTLYFRSLYNFNDRDIEDSLLLEIRYLLEMYSVRKAVFSKEKKKIKDFLEVIRRQKEEYLDEDKAEELDKEFHITLAGFSNNELLKVFINTVCDLSTLRRKKYFNDGDRRLASYMDHIVIIESILSEDLVYAEAQMAIHLKRANTYYEQTSNIKNIEVGYK